MRKRTKLEGLDKENFIKLVRLVIEACPEDKDRDGTRGNSKYHKSLHYVRRQTVQAAKDCVDYQTSEKAYQIFFNHHKPKELDIRHYCYGDEPRSEKKKLVVLEHATPVKVLIQSLVELYRSSNEGRQPLMTKDFEDIVFNKGKLWTDENIEKIVMACQSCWVTKEENEKLNGTGFMHTRNNVEACANLANCNDWEKCKNQTQCFKTKKCKVDKIYNGWRECYEAVGIKIKK
jgi:hypothetical protein